MERESKSDTVRVHPWVSYGLTALLAVGSLVILATSPDVDEEIGKSPEMLEAREFFERNPDVEINGRFARWLGSEYVKAVRANHEERRKAGAVAVLSPRIRAKTQTKFDGLQKDAFASLDELPAWRFGIVSGESPFQNTFLHLVTHESVIAVGVSIAFFAVAALTLEVAWGSLLFGGFMLLLPFLSSLTYLALAGEHSDPWTGPSAVIAALLGAYAVRGLQGFVIPPWVLLPVWAFCEYVLVRDLGVDSFDTTPVLVQGISLAFGAALAGGIWFFDLEEKFEQRAQDTPDLVSNPVLEQALEARMNGSPDAAFELLEAELRRAPANHDVAIALWEVSTGSDRAQRAVPALLAAIRDGLRRGRRDEAVGLWRTLAAELGVPQTDANLLVRVGEALAVDGERAAALEALSSAVYGPKPLSPVLSMRVARCARNLDPALAAQAAGIALADDQLGASERAELEAVRAAAPATAAASPAPKASSSVRTPARAAAHPAQHAQESAADPFAALADGETLAAPETPAAPEGVWSEPGLVEDLSSELSDEAGFDWSGLQEELEAEAAREDAPPQAPQAPEAPEVAEEAPEVDTSVDLSDAGPAEVSEPTETSETSETTETLEEGGSASPRELRIRAAVPLELEDEGLSLEIDGSGKTLLPYERVEALAAGAVQGLADRPVLLVDLVLNWRSPAEALKVIRIRSDAFDPRRVVPGHESALAALQALLASVLNRSGATPLPHRDAAQGAPFETFPDLDTYVRNVLRA